MASWAEPDPSTLCTDLVEGHVDGIAVVGDDVGHVVLAAAGHRHVGRVAGEFGREHGVARVNGDALGTVDGQRVAELDVLGDVVSGQGRRAVSFERGGLDGPVVADVGDCPACSVDDELGCGGGFVNEDVRGRCGG